MYSIQVSNSRCLVIVFTHWLDQKDRNNAANCKKKHPCLQGIYSEAVLFQKLESPHASRKRNAREANGTSWVPSVRSNSLSQFLPMLMEA
jgi:hypothetical protein